MPTMKTILFDTLKAKAILEIDRRLSRSHSYMDTTEMFNALLAASMEPREDPRAVIKDWHERAVALVKAWDVRKVGTLMQLFPAILPHRCEAYGFSIDQNEKADWIITWN